MLGRTYEAVDLMRGIRGMRGFDSISVSPGPHLEHPEWIVYQENQVYSNYKIYYKIKNWNVNKLYILIDFLIKQDEKIVFLFSWKISKKRSCVKHLEKQSL